MGLGRFIQEEKVNRRGKKREEVMLAARGPSLRRRMENCGAVRLGIAWGQVLDGREGEERGFKAGL